MSDQRSRRATKAKRRPSKSPSARAGEFVREEIHHVRDGEHGARSTEQLIAIALSKARRAGVKLPPRKRATAATRKADARDAEVARTHRKPSAARSRAARAALAHEGTEAASHASLSRHARDVARSR